MLGVDAAAVEDRVALLLCGRSQAYTAKTPMRI
jgi:hypothetical protein